MIPEILHKISKDVLMNHRVTFVRMFLFHEDNLALGYERSVRIVKIIKHNKCN